MDKGKETHLFLNIENTGRELAATAKEIFEVCAVVIGFCAVTAGVVFGVGHILSQILY